METKLNLIIDNEFSDQILSDPEIIKELETHCEGVSTSHNLRAFIISDKAGRVVYTSNIA